MDQSKPWYTSTTIWGSIIAVVSPLIGLLFHLNLTSADSAALADALAGIGAGAGGLVAVYGRLSATTTIGKK